MRRLTHTKPAVAAAILSVVIMLAIGTVGHGDLYPTTDTSHLFTDIFLVSGAAAVLASLTAVGSALLARRGEHVAEHRAHGEGGGER